MAPFRPPVSRGAMPSPKKWSAMAYLATSGPGLTEALLRQGASRWCCDDGARWRRLHATRCAGRLAALDLRFAGRDVGALVGGGRGKLARGAREIRARARIAAHHRDAACLGLVAHRAIRAGIPGARPS